MDSLVLLSPSRETLGILLENQLKHKKKLRKKQHLHYTTEEREKRIPNLVDKMALTDV
jgi:hypothetical protein